MNIRGTDPAALTAVTDLFVAPAPVRDGGQEFQRALQPQPVESKSATAPRTETPRSDARHSEPQRAVQPAESKRSAEASTDRAPEVCAAPADDIPALNEHGPESAEESAAEVVVAETDVAGDEPAEEPDVVAESLAVAASVVADQPVPEKRPVVETVDVVTAEPVAVVEATAGEVVSLAADTITTQVAAAPTAAEQVAPTATAEVVLPTEVENLPAVEKPLEEVAAETATTKAQTGGIGVLPSAVTPAGNGKTAITPPRSTATTKSVQSRELPVETATEPASAAAVGDFAQVVPAEEIVAGQIKYDEREGKKSAQASEQTAISANLPAQENQPPVETLAVETIKAETPAPPTDGPVVSDLHSTQHQAQDGTKLSTQPPVANAAVVNRLPTHALVRNTPQATPESAPLHVDAARFLQRVAKAFETARDRGGEIRLRLSPPELGALRVEVNLSEQGLAARVEVENQDARAILLDNLPALRERLAEQGLRLERFDVDLSQREPDQHSGNFPDQPRDRQTQSETRTTKTNTPRPNVAEVTQSESSTTSGWHDRQLNVIV